MAGFGLAAFGIAPYGTGTPEPADEPATGPAGSRYINPATRDYEQDPVTGQLRQMRAMQQRVLIAVLTVKRSASATRQVGIVLPRKMGTSFEVEMEHAVRDALYQMTDVEKVIRVDRITTVRGGSSRSTTTIEYTDLTAREKDTVSF